MRVHCPARCFLLLSGLWLFLACSDARADIYRFQDENGTWHFTNVKRDKRYHLYIRLDETRPDPSTYITDYEHIIKQAAGRFRVDPSLVKAVIRAESAFDHQAISSKGAQGLMQLMPATADEMEVKDPFNPEENIFGGTRYLSLLLERYNQDKPLALAAYNAGPENVKKYGGVPPFPETITFIERVLKFFRQYQSNK